MGVVELEIELLTGRTHQIRGQLALEGMPICGDTLYGGAKVINRGLVSGYTGSGNLALQCCELEFYDPVYLETPQGQLFSSRSSKLNRFCLDQAWWSSLITSEQSSQTKVCQNLGLTGYRSHDNDTSTLT